MTTKTEKAAAVLTIKDAGKMTVRGQREVAEWLRQQARDLIKEGHLYNPRFRARYMYIDGK